jgi:PPOX class probable F420-dependent enzyme
MSMNDKDLAFLEKNHAAAMATLRPDGTPHVVRVGVALVNGKLWSSGTHQRVRTGHLRRDPRCTVLVWDPKYSSLTLETRVTILEGADVPELSVQLFRVMQAGMDPGPAPGNLIWNGQEKSPEEFQQAMIEEERLIYQFEVERTYGLR